MLGLKKIFPFFIVTILSLLAACSSKNESEGESEIIVDPEIEGNFSQFQNFSKPEEKRYPNPAELPPLNYVRGVKVRNIGYLNQVFNDSNISQLQEAQRLGIEPISDLSSAYFTRRPLVKVSSNEYYHIDSLRHSVPYLVPEAATLLKDIGKNFIDTLHARGGDSYKIKVTSLLRTPESVSRLRRVNINATDSSTHQYATTFDISYTNFYCLNERRQIDQGDLKNLLGEVLQDLRQQGRCLVKYERKTGCFHVTVTK